MLRASSGVSADSRHKRFQVYRVFCQRSNGSPTTRLSTTWSDATAFGSLTTECRRPGRERHIPLAQRKKACRLKVRHMA
eukprot:1504239-Pyramimonas_sp.AAC.1